MNIKKMIAGAILSITPPELIRELDKREGKVAPWNVIELLALTEAQFEKLKKQTGKVVAHYEALF